MADIRWDADAMAVLEHTAGMSACRRLARDVAHTASALLPVFHGDVADSAGMDAFPPGDLKRSVRVFEDSDARGEYVAVAANIVDLFLEEPAEQYHGVRRPGIRAALDMQAGRVIG